MEKKKIAVYPYNYEFTPFLRYGKLTLDNFVLVSPKSWSLCGKDASVADGGGKIGINVISDTNSITDCEVLVIPEYRKDDQIDKIVVDLMIRHMNSSKSIYYMSSNVEIIPVYVREYDKFKISHSKLPFQDDYFDKNLKEIKTPIIVICGLMSETSKFDVLYVTSNSLKDMGFTCSVISPKSYSGLLSYYDYPSVISDDIHSMYDRTIMFNHYIKQIEETSQPDVIIIEIPSGIMAYSEKIHNNFGYMSSMLFNAVQPDFACLCIPCTNVTDEYIALLKNLIYYRFNVMIDCFYYSNKKIDSKPYIKDDSMVPVIYDNDIFIKKYKKIMELVENEKIYNFNNENDISLYISQILKKLGAMINETQ